MGKCFISIFVKCLRIKCLLLANCFHALSLIAWFMKLFGVSKMPAKKICYLKCEKDESVKLFKFPSVELDAKRRRRWFALLGVKDSSSLTKTYFLCAKHFSEKQLTGNFLLTNSVPDMNLQKSNHFNIENSVSIELTGSDDDDDDDDGIRTIRVDKELYKRIMNNNIVPETPPAKHFASKNMQTGTDSVFPCAMVEYDFEKRGYCLQCSFCPDKFFIHEWDLFEMHMLYQHDDFRKNFHKAYTKTQKDLMAVQKKYAKSAVQVNDIENNSTEDQTPAITENSAKVATPTPQMETNELTPLNQSNDGMPSADPLDISHQRTDILGSEANAHLDSEQRSFIFKKIILKKLCDEKQTTATTAPKISQKPNEIELNKSNEEKISEGVNYLIHELGIDDIEFLEDIQRSSNTLSSCNTVAKESTPTKSSLSISKEDIVQSKSYDSCVTIEKLRKCKVLLKRIQLPKYNKKQILKEKQQSNETLRENSRKESVQIPAKEQRTIEDIISNLEKAKTTVVLKKNSKLQVNSNVEQKEFNTTFNDHRDQVDNAESEFDTIEMLIEEDETITKSKKEHAESGKKLMITSDIEASTAVQEDRLSTYKCYDPFLYETNEIQMGFNNYVGTNKFNKNIQISSNEDSLCCSDVYSSDEDEEDSSCEYKTNDNEIRFRSTAPPIVHHFIELLRLNSVLWFDRFRSAEKYDFAVTNIILELSAAHKFTMTTLEVRRSINRIKKWFLNMVNKMSDPRNKNRITLPYSPKYDAYFKKCFEFLPSKENYEKWFTSQTIESTFRAKHLSVIPVYECEFCKILFETKHSYELHMNMQHKKCKQCSAYLADDEKLAKHMETHQNMKARQHTKTDQNTKTDQKPKAKPNYECEICHKGYYLKHMLRAHLATHGKEYIPTVRVKDGIKVFPCQYCGEEFETSHMRKWHELKHEGPQHKCSYCEKRYYTGFTLRQHMKLHRNERDYICDLCGKAYCTRKTLLAHQDVSHFRKYSINCDICGVEISNQTNLKRHKSTAHAAPNEEFIDYVSRRNGQTFLCKRRKRTLRRAPYSRDGQKWKCKLCGLEFPKFKPLMLHKREVHSINKIVPCPICNKRMGEEYINRHIKQVHKDATITEVELETLDQQSVEIDLENENIEIDYNIDENGSHEIQYINKQKENLKNSLSYIEETETDIIVDDADNFY